MAQLGITIADSLQQRIIDGVCGQYGYKPFIEQNGEQVPNPITKPQFCKNIIRSFLKEVVTAYELNKTLEQTKQIESQKIFNELDLSEPVV